jgi:hypothetical protein
VCEVVRIFHVRRSSGRPVEQKITLKRPGVGILFRIEQRGWQPVVVVVRVHGDAQAELPQVVGATDSIGLVFSVRQSWHEQGCQDRYNSNNDEQFDQSEGRASFH